MQGKCRRNQGGAPSALPFTAPPSTPRTKNLCMVMTMMSGSRIEMNVAAIMSVSPWPLDCTMPAVITVSGEWIGPELRTVSSELTSAVRDATYPEQVNQTRERR